MVECLPAILDPKMLSRLERVGRTCLTVGQLELSKAVTEDLVALAYARAFADLLVDEPRLSVTPLIFLGYYFGRSRDSACRGLDPAKPIRGLRLARERPIHYRGRNYSGVPRLIEAVGVEICPAATPSAWSSPPLLTGAGIFPALHDAILSIHSLLEQPHVLCVLGDLYPNSSGAVAGLPTDAEIEYLGAEWEADLTGAICRLRQGRRIKRCAEHHRLWEKWSAEGLSHAAIAQKYFDVEGIRVTSSAISKGLARK